jgi:hypothetical protein
LGYENSQSAQAPLWNFFSATVFGLRKMLRIFFIANQKTSYTAGTLYAIKSKMLLTVPKYFVKMNSKIMIL